MSETIEFFNFLNVNDSITGTFKGYIKSVYGIALVLESTKDKTKYFVGLQNVSLKRLISLVYNDLKVDKDVISIKFLGFAKTKDNKRKVKLFEVKINGKVLEDTKFFNEASQTDLKDFFNTKPQQENLPF